MRTAPLGPSPIHHLRSKVLMQTELYMTFHVCFIETLVITHTVDEILAQIDHKGPN